MATWLFAAAGVQAGTGAAHRRGATSSDPSTGPFSIKVYDDRMTIAVAGAAQVYIYGVIDADSPRLMQSKNIPSGSDVYLNATGDNLDAGMALGRLLRQGSMSTHLGLPTRGHQKKSASRSSVCTGACVYAYLGGTYRWAPTGNDRFGIATDVPGHAAGNAGTPAATGITAYLKDMGIDAAAFATARADTHERMAWPTSDQMILTGLANNGRQPMVASYRVTGRIPELELDQLGRRGEQRLTLQCRPDGVSLLAYDKVGADRAQQIVRRVARSYVEIDRQETLPQALGGAIIDHDAVTIERRFPSDQRQQLLSAKTIGAWVVQQNSTLRYGFAFRLQGIERVVRAFDDACRAYAPIPHGKRS